MNADKLFVFHRRLSAFIGGWFVFPGAAALSYLGGQVSH
jgi:hypothetical protein